VSTPAGKVRALCLETGGLELRNPFRDPARRPEWAELTRLAGDHVATLFEGLRTEISRIEGLVEELHHGGADIGWVPRYRLGETTLFTAHIFPGVLEATIEVAGPWRANLLASRKLSREFKELIQNTASHVGVVTLRVVLGDQKAVRAFSQVVRLKSRFVAIHPTQ
jgi:hypothetical protein